MALDDAFFEAMRRKLREEVEAQRQRASRGAEFNLSRRGLFGESTIAAQAFAGIGGESTKAIGAGETAIQGREFEKELQEFLIRLQQPSGLIQALTVIGQGAGAVAGSLGGKVPIPTAEGSGNVPSFGRSAQDPFQILGQGASQRDLVTDAQTKFARRRNTRDRTQSQSGQFDLNSLIGRRAGF